MGFGDHIDSAIRSYKGTDFRIRTDLSATLFLAEPETYDLAAALFEVQVYLGLIQLRLGQAEKAAELLESCKDGTGRYYRGQALSTIGQHADAADAKWAEPLAIAVTDHVGRLIWNGYPTGVTVVPAMNHGGPYPSSTSSLHSAVGTTAIRRFLRPVAYQNVPDAMLPTELQNANPLGIERIVNNKRTRERS